MENLNICIMDVIIQCYVCSGMAVTEAYFDQWFYFQAFALDRKGTFKVEYLQKIEQDVQARWEEAKIYEVDAPLEPRKSPDEKFFCTFPFPYMNGRLHLGHTFSLSKCEVIKTSG